MILMKQDGSAMTKDKKEILEDIKKPYLIKPVTAVMVLILTAFIFFLIIGAINNVGKNISSDFISALINLFFVWNLGFGLYKGAWQYLNSRKINKVLFPKLDQFINESKEKGYDETETEVYEKVKVAYTDYAVVNYLVLLQLLLY